MTAADISTLLRSSKLKRKRVVETKYYHLVKKKSLEQNLVYRRQMLEYAYASTDNAEELWIICKRDILFYVNTFVWTFDPRLVPKSTIIPFITFEFQDEALLEIVDSILTGQDLLIEKSRDTGASWLILIAYKWLWTFYDALSFRLVSRVEDLVDKNEDPDCLFWKLMFIIEHEPDFIMKEGNFNKTHLHLQNKLNGSVIDGASTTGDVARGGRCSSMMLDEFASVPEGFEVLKATRDTANSRIFNSTPKGASNAFYDIGYNTEIMKLRFHWSKDPRKNMGLYTIDENKNLKILDPECRGYFRVGRVDYFYPDEYPFVLDGKLRSPWYDHQCKRAAHPTEIAQELDIDYLGSDYQFFWPDDLLRVEKEMVRRPMFVGEFEFNPVNHHFIDLRERENGRLRLWVEPDIYKRISPDIEAVIGVDIATGTGASNSAITISNKKTREDIGEWTCPHTTPNELAHLVFAMAKYFNDAFLIWDSGGPGSIFGKTIREIGYGNIYYKTDEKSIERKVSTIPGFHFDQYNKTPTLATLRDAIHNNEYIVRSKEFIREARDYIYVMAQNTVAHSRSRTTIDPSGAKENHGDLVISKALALKVIRLYGNDDQEGTPKKPQFCFAARRERYNRKIKSEKEW